MNRLLRSTSIVALVGSLAAFACPSSARAGSSVGVGAALALDLPDPASSEHTKFGPGPSFQIPIRIGLAPNANLRVNARGDTGTGSNRLTWAEDVNGADVRFYAEEQTATFVAAGLTVGPEVILPVSGPIRPYLGANLGAAWVGTYHSLGEDGRTLLDPAASDAGPTTSQFAFLTDFDVGAMTGGDTAGWLELGYSNAWVGERALSNTDPALDARREAFGWNAARVGVGVAFSL